MKAPSGNFVLRISPQLHRNLRDTAARRGLSLNALCSEILGAAVDGSAGPTAGGRSGRGGGPMAQVVERCREVFADQLLGVVHFGSTARKQAFPDSDVDLLLVMDTSVPLRRALYAQWSDEVEPLTARLFEREVSPHFSHMPSSPAGAGGLWLEVAIDGRVLWEREDVVSNALRGILTHLAEGGATRRIQHGHPYWVRDRGKSAEEPSK
jgi:predicted nucleotidyltransferase